MSEQPAKTTSSPGNISGDKNLLVIFSVTLMAVLGVSSITPAFPKIVTHFDISPQEVGLLITVFTLPGVLIALFAGVLGDRLGRKKILVPSLFVFGIAGTACAFASNFDELLVLRLIQGIGAASLGTLNTTLIGDLYEGRLRTTIMGYNASVLSIGTASYPAIGGLLAIFGWNYPFFLPVTAIPVGLFVLLKLKNPEPDSTEHIRDYLRNAWQSVKNKEAVLLFSASLVTFILLYGPYLTFFPLLLDSRYGSSSFVIGLMISIASIATAVTSSQLGKLSRIFAERTLIKIGFALYLTSLAITPLLANFWELLIPIILFGIAQGTNVPSIFTLLTNLAPLEYRAAVMSVNGTILRLGQTLGPLVMGGVYGVWGIDGTFFVGAALALFTGIILVGALHAKVTSRTEDSTPFSQI
ncbi:MAG: MFS transporter [Candidatus Zixiibacteriota bacterium]